MKNKFIIVYTIFASIGFLFAISFFGLNLYKEYSYTSLNTDKKFNNITGELTYAAKDPNLNTKILINKLNDSVGSLNDFSFLSISINDVELIKFPGNSNQKDTSSKFTKSYETYIQTEVGKFHICANIYLLKPSSVFYYAKISFLIVLIITLLTVVLIIYENVNESKSELIVNNSVDLSDEDTDADEESSAIKEADNSTAATEETVIEETNIQEENEVPVSEENTDSKAEETIADNIETQNDTPAPETEVKLPSEEEKPLAIDTSDNPTGLFNPVTGLGWEQYLFTRLESEINRAIASEIDFSLFVIEIADVERTSETFKNVCNYLSLQFQFKDLLFEYKDDCIIAMKINMNLDEALNLADKVYASIKNIIENKACYIGISTRSIRMVSGERLLKEATEALVHAKDDKDSPIIAFRVDEEKYRQFLEQNNKA